MNTPTPIPASETAPLWELRYLIGYNGVAGAQRLDTLRRTGWDAVHAMQTYVCATKEEWDMLGKTLVCKMNKRLLQLVELFCASTGERRKLVGGEQFTVAEPSAARQTVVDGGLPEAGSGVDTGAPSQEFQTPGGSQSGGGDEPPVEPEGTFSEAEPQDAVGGSGDAGEAEVAEINPRGEGPDATAAAAPSASTAAVKNKGGRPKKTR